MNEPIHTCIAHWHQLLHGEFPGGLDELLHDDVVFLSPVVFTPQVGKEITKLYLSAAGTTLSGGKSLESAEVGDESGDSDTGSGGFRYTKEILSGHHAMLEFETTMDGKYVNGVDIITCDDEARIVEFRVMVRPLQAINLLHQQMKDMLEQLSG